MQYNPEETCFGTFSPHDYWSLPIQKVEKLVQTEMTFANHDSCVSNRYRDAEYGLVSSTLDSAVERISSMQEIPEAVIPLEWKNTAHFKEDWFSKIELNQNNLFPLQSMKQNTNLRTWFVYYFNEE